MKSWMLRACTGLAVMALASACAGSAPASGGAVLAPTRASAAPTSAAAARPTPSTVPNRPTAEAMIEPADTAVASAGPAWLDVELRDVNSGRTFRLSDFQGKPVLVEAMAVWCVNCLRQQRTLVQLHSALGDQVESVAIDVDLNESEDLLKKHAERNGFAWRYALASPELVQAFSSEFGTAFLNPPSVPMFLIDPAGDIHLLDFGQKSVEYLTQQIQAYP